MGEKDRKIIESIRLLEERRLHESLSRALNVPLLENLSRFLSPVEQNKERYFFLKAHSLSVKTGILKSLEELFGKVKYILGLEDFPVELFVVEDRYTCANVTPGNVLSHPAFICLNSALVRSLKEPEIAFVLGHELAHLVLKHSEFREAVMLLYKDLDKLPPHLKTEYDCWHKLSEMSADRVALLASCDIEAALRAMIICISGVDDNLLTLSLEQIIKYATTVVEEIKQMKIFTECTHPAMPLRILALKAFYDSNLYKSLSSGNYDSLSQVDVELETKLAELTRVIKKYPTNVADYWLMMTKAAATWLIISADANVTPEERAGLLDVIAKYCWCPEEILNDISEKETESFLKLSVENLKANRASALNEVLRDLAFFLIGDRRIEPAEYEKYLEIAENYLGFGRFEAIDALTAAIKVFP